MSFYVHKTYLWEQLFEPALIQKDLSESFYPPTHDSSDYKNRIAILDLMTCLICRNSHGKIYEIDEIVNEEPPVHPSCRCEIKSVRAAFAGMATQDGINGADVSVRTTGILPPNYITKKEAIAKGWISWQGNLDKVAPGKTIGGEIYKNRNEHLPQVIGRVWHEADINYNNGFRNTQRLIFSNDGLIFATYDHYMTFVQIQ